jgi:hypothetical protein
MGTHRSYIWCHQEPTRSAGIRQGIHDVTSQRMCCGKWAALGTSYVIVKRVPVHGRQSLSRYLFTFGPMLIGTFLLKWGWGIPRKCLWHRFWDTRYNDTNFIWLRVSTRTESSSGHFNLLLWPNSYYKWNVSSLQDPIWLYNGYTDKRYFKNRVMSWN